MAEEWTTVSKKDASKRRHHYTTEKAQKLEAMTNCRFLAPALRSEALEELFNSGWTFTGIRKASDDAAPDLSGEHKIVPVKDNPWGDTIILHRQHHGSDG